jgi:hypothetical protein
MCANPELNGTHIFSSSFSSHANAAVQYHTAMSIRRDSILNAQRDSL